MSVNVAATAGRRMKQYGKAVSSRKVLVVAIVAVAILLVLAIVVDPAFAAPGYQDSGNDGGIGKGFGQMLQSWAKWLIPGAAAIVGVPMLARAEVGPAIMVFFLAMLLGAFAFMNDTQFGQLVQPVLDSIK